MSKWQRQLSLKDVWPTRDVALIAKTIADRLGRIEPLGEPHIDWQREDLAEQFADIATDSSPDIEEFNCLMSDLYDWADTKIDGQWNGKAVCWIATF